MIYNLLRKKRIQITNYLTFSSPNPFSISVATPGWNGKLYYSTDTKTWSEWTGNEVNATEEGGIYALYFAGAGNTKISGNSSCYWTLNGSSISCTGNIESLLDYETVAAGHHPTLADYCYSSMFSDCTSLTTAPSLPATTLTDSCYNYMFRGCRSLTTAPSLPATTLADYCYSSMFSDCTSLTTAPSLPATTLTDSCYNYMFRGCRSLTTAPSLPATTLADYCYSSMFSGCTSLTTVPSLPATTLTNSCYNYMFRGCTSLTTAPSLPATTLTKYCYSSMFYGCTSIKLAISKSREYDKEYRIPKSGNGVTATRALNDMFARTGGTFTGTPSINTTYYTSNTIV